MVYRAVGSYKIKIAYEICVINYLILFSTAFLAATLLPAQSEAVLVGMLHLSQQSVFLLVLIATLGNVMGSTVNWWLGMQLQHYKDRSWFPVRAERLEQMQGHYQRYGSWILLLSWAPVIGDPITLVAGVLKEKFNRFLILVTIAKAARYLIIAAVYFYSTSYFRS